MIRIPAGHEIVNSAELATLRRKAESHDAYLWAVKRMADKARQLRTAARDDGTIGPWEYGYTTCLTDFAQLVKDAPMG